MEIFERLLNSRLNASCRHICLYERLAESQSQNIGEKESFYFLTIFQPQRIYAKKKGQQ